MSIWDLAAKPQDGREASEDMKLYRSFLGFTQAQLADKLCTTQTSVARWESGFSPISLRTMAHLTEIVRGRVLEEAGILFKKLLPDLLHSEFWAPLIWGLSTGIRQDREEKLYLGSFLVGDFKSASFHIRIDDHRWYALDRDSNATLVDQRLLKEATLAGKSA